jgi:hypothetical protein
VISNGRQKISHYHQANLIWRSTKEILEIFLKNPALGPYFDLLKSFSIFPSPAGMSLTKLSLGRNHEIIPAQGDFGK